jgi:hypothetical protein
VQFWEGAGLMDMSTDVEERIAVAAPPETIYNAVADVRRLAKWSPECFAVWIWRRRDGQPANFVGWNRRGSLVWFTTCAVRVAEPGREFAFDVTAFGMPVSRWGYRLSALSDGTEVTEYWQDRRGRGAMTLGRIFTGRSALIRPQINRDGMRITLERLKQEIETP